MANKRIRTTPSYLEYAATAGGQTYTVTGTGVVVDETLVATIVAAGDAVGVATVVTTSSSPVTPPDDVFTNAQRTELAATFASLNDDGELVVNGVVVETGSNLEGTAPVSARIDIVTAGKADIVSKVDYLPATITVTGVPGVADYAGLCQIRGRGNYTWSLPKKPYKLKFAAAVSLMGMPAFNDWALLANHTDPSKINNALAFAIGSQADGLDWTPSSEYGQLYLNGEYVGLYQFTETIKRGVARVNIDKAGTTGLALTGGYMLEGDENYVAFGDPGFTTTNGVKVIYDDPDGAVTGQADYIRGKVQEFEDALFGSSWLDATTGYARFIDRDSFIDHYLIEELSSNQEGAWNSSQKFYRTRDTSTVPGRFFMGPLWDFDVAFGSVVNLDHPAVGYFARPGAKWIERMFQDPTFRAAVAVRWTAMAARLNATATGYAATIDALTARVASAALADQERWSYNADWAALATFKKSWLATRIAWLTSVYAATAAPTNAPANLASSPGTDYTILTWDAVTTGPPAVSYDVQQLISATWTTIASSFATTATISDLTASTEYQFRVAGRNDIGLGPYATITTSTTDDVSTLRPDEVNGLAYWVKANDIAGSDGASVALWEDAIGDRDITATGDNRPTLRTTGAGLPAGKSAVEFDGSDDVLVSASTGTINLPVSAVFMVMRVDPGSPDYFGALTNNSGAGFVYTASGPATSWLTDVVSNYERDGIAVNAVSNDGTWHVYSATSSDGTYLPEFRFGNDRGNPGRFLDGAIAEVATFDRVVTGPERAAITQGLKTKYGIA